MGKRFLKALMVFAFLWTLFIVVQGVLESLKPIEFIFLSFPPIMLVLAIQYVIYASINPFYLFKKQHDTDMQ